MDVLPRASALAPFRVRSFRFQWLADLAASWALEMETIILGWYVLAETRSVIMLTVFASLLYLGTLLSPMFGVLGDRYGQRILLFCMRSVYAACAFTVMACTFLGILTPTIILGTTFILGMVRPSDVGMRAALVGSIMPPNQLVGAMSVQRTTQDSARVAGSLTGASLVALLGMGPAYVAVLSFYILSLLLILIAGDMRLWRRPAPAGESPGSAVKTTSARPAPFTALKEGFVYAWRTPVLRATLLLALLLNMTAFPQSISLLPVMARNVYEADQTTLGYLAAAFAGGGLIGAVLLSRFAHLVAPGRMFVVFVLGWYAMLAVFSHTPTPAIGVPVMVLAGLCQILGLVPSTVLLLRATGDGFRGRIMGLRALSVYGNLPGLIVSGPLIAAFGYPATSALYCAFGVLGTLLIAFRWRHVLWHADAPMNRR